MRFFSIRRVSEDTEISLRAVRNAYHSERTSIRKASGEVYTQEWERPVAPIDTRECYHCHKALIVKGRSTWFNMERKVPFTFTSLYVASKVTGISNNALRNACKKNNKKIAQRKEEFAMYKIDWFNICRECDPSPPKKSRSVVENYIIPRWDINELFL